MRKLQSLRIKVPFFVMCLMFVIVTILVSLTINIGAKGIRNSSIFGLESTTRVYARMINAWLKQAMVISDSISSGFAGIRNHLAINNEETRAVAEATLRNIVANNEEIEASIIFDREGNPILDSIGGRFINSSANIDLRGTELWTRVLSGETSMYHTVVPSPLGDNKWLIEIFSPVRNSLGDIIGVVSVMVDWHSFIDEELNSVKFGNTGHPFIVDSERTVIADTVPSNIRNRIIQDADYIKYVRENESGYYEFESPLNGKKTVATFNREPISDWAVVMSVESEELFSHIYSMIKYAVIGVVIILLIADVIIYLYMGTIIKILKLLSLDLDRLAQGDLTWRVPPVLLTRKDEFGTIAISVERILDVLNEKVRIVYNSANTVKSSAEEVAQGNIDLSERTENQASGLEETASSMEQIASTIKSSADHTVAGNNMMINSRSAVEDAGRIIEETTQNIEAVFESSSKISAITKIIESIAFQTNILALNAAVEAARAGEQGRGFAVVASEVRNLAQTTQASVKDITALVSDSEEKIATATETARESKEIFNNLKHQIEETAKIMQDLSSTAMEQQAGVNQVNIAIAQMDMATQQNAALVEESTAASQTLFYQAKELLNAMEFFILKEEEYSNTLKNKTETIESPEHAEDINEYNEYKNEYKEDNKKFDKSEDNLISKKEDNKIVKKEEKKEILEKKSDISKPLSEIKLKSPLKSPIKSPLDADKKKYEETKPMPAISKDKEFGSTFNNYNDNDEGFESF